MRSRFVTRHVLPAISLVRMNLIAVRSRPGPSLVVTIGVACAVLVATSMLSIGAGIEAMAMKNARADRALVRRASSSAGAALTNEHLQWAAQAPGVKRTDAGAFVAGELTVVLQARRKDSDVRTNLAARGVDARFTAVHPEIRIAAGRMFHPGRYELIVGKAAQKVYGNLEIGDHLNVRGARWQVVGVYEAQRGLAETWVLGDAATFMTAFHRDGYDRITVALQSSRDLDAFSRALQALPGADFLIESEAAVVARQARTMNATTNFVSYFVAGVMAVGASMGALSSMHAVVARRRRELATLRAVGFSSCSVFTSLVVETFALAIPGGLIGIALPWLALNGIDVAFVGLNFALRVTPELAAIGLLWTAAMAFAGGLLPAVRAARMPIARALRE